MMHTTHSWTLWLAYDPIYERTFKYRRECRELGCHAVEFAKEVEAVGPTTYGTYATDPELDSVPQMAERDAESEQRDPGN